MEMMVEYEWNYNVLKWELHIRVNMVMVQSMVFWVVSQPRRL